MTNGAEFLPYSLCTDAAWGTIWGDGVVGSTVAGAGNGAIQGLPIYAQFNNINAPYGAYSDTVQVTISW